MGVKGLWRLIESAGVPVPVETLENKVLGVDVSIWLHQAVRGFRGPGGAAVANAHLLTLFHRICKLLFYRIRPVFVFDGGVPHLKKQTLASRKLRREVATNRAKKVRERLFNNILKSQAVRNALGRTGAGPSSVHVPKVVKKEKDLYELPPMTESLGGDGTTESLLEERNGAAVHYADLPDLHQFDLESEEFKNLPLDTKHEILSELQSTRKQNSWGSINDMPQQSENFAEFQMNRLMKRAKFQATLDSTRDEIQRSKVSEMEAELFGEMEKYQSLSRRIISEDASHAIFVKKIKEASPSNAEVTDAESEELDNKTDRKGKAPLKKKSMDKDFLTELARVGIIQPDSDSDVESESYHLHDKGEDVYDRRQQSRDEEDYFLQTVGSLMEDSGLTQDEILALIKQDQGASVNFEHTSGSCDGPSTSANAPGGIYKPDDSSSDEDDLIEVSDDAQCPQVVKEEDQKAVNNIKELLETKSNNLWMKIVQQKVDDMVQVNMTSPKKAIVDSRNVEKSPVAVNGPVKLERRNSAVKEHATEGKTSESLKPVKISLDFEVKPIKMEDNIFSDIFSDLLCQPQPAKTNKLAQESHHVGRQSAGGHGLANKRLKLDHDSDSQTSSCDAERRKSVESDVSDNDGVKDCKIDGNAAHWKQREDETVHDEVEIMSSSDESDDEQDASIHIRSSANTQSTRNQSEPKTKSENEDVNGLQRMSEECMSFPDKDSNSQSSKSLVLEKKDQRESVTTIKENTLHEKTYVNDDSKSTKSSNCRNQITDDLRQHAASSSHKIIKTNSVQTSHVEYKNNTPRSPACGSGSGGGDVMEAAGSGKERDVETAGSGVERDVEAAGSGVERDVETAGSGVERDVEAAGSGKERDVNSEKNDSEQSKVSSQSFHRGDNMLETAANSDTITGEDTGDEEQVIEESTKKKVDVLDTGDKKKVNGESTEKKVDVSEGSTDKLYSDKSNMEIVEGNWEAEDFEAEEQAVERPLKYTEDELKQLEVELASEQETLVAQAHQTERLASSLNDQMYGESQHLLQLFGIPYLVAPMEAEAQCAFLNVAKLTEGTITDDSDVFLFGGSSVYRNFFNQTRHVEFYKTDNIKVTLGLERSKMITLALLCGSDYTEGIEGIGAVGAMEVLAEFPGEGIECLRKVKKWWSVASQGVHANRFSKIRQKLTQVHLSDSFPSENVYQAYMVPEVDESREKFTWAVPNVEALRRFTAEKFGWNTEKTDEILLPVMKKLKIKTSQRRIESYFTTIRLVKEPKVASKRIKDAIAKSRGITVTDSDYAGRQSGTLGKLRKENQKRNVKKVSKSEHEEYKESTEEASQSKHSKPTRTLLVDASDLGRNSATDGRKGKKRKKNAEEDGKVTEDDKEQKRRKDVREGNKEDDVTPSPRGTETQESPPPKKLTKEDMFKHLLEKETICQREKEKLEMQEKKKKAASLLKMKLTKETIKKEMKKTRLFIYTDFISKNSREKKKQRVYYEKNLTKEIIKKR